MATDKSDKSSSLPTEPTVAPEREYASSRWERPLPPIGKVRRGPPQKGMRSAAPLPAPPSSDERPRQRGIEPVDERRRIRPGDPLRNGGIITVTPRYYLTQGFAQAEERGRLIAVWGGVVGESADVRVQHVGKNRIRARFVAPARGSSGHPGRRAPPCDRYDACGSCPLMHLDAPAQRAARLHILKRALDGVGLGEYAPTELAQVEDGELAYRHVAKLAVGRSDRGHLRVGVFRRGSHDLVAIPQCGVVTDSLREAMRVTARAVIELDLGPWDPYGQDGALRHIVLRQSRTTGEILGTIIGAWNERAFGELARRMTTAAANIVGVHLHINSKEGNAIFDHGEGEEEGAPRFLRLAGARVVTEDVAGQKLEIGPGDFFQANPTMGAELVQTALDWLAPWSDRPVVDLYCGVGAFTLPLAARHGWALGVEVVSGAVDRAASNARRNHTSAEFMTGAVDEVLRARAPQLSGRGAVVVADPARRGLEEGVIDSMLSIDPAAVLLVSCNSAAFGRDLRGFLERGWTIAKIRAFDMFPQTVHMESMALLLPSQAPEPTTRSPQRRFVR